MGHQGWVQAGGGGVTRWSQEEPKAVVVQQAWDNVGFNWAVGVWGVWDHTPGIPYPGCVARVWSCLLHLRHMLPWFQQGKAAHTQLWERVEKQKAVWQVWLGVVGLRNSLLPQPSQGHHTHLSAHCLHTPGQYNTVQQGSGEGMPVTWVISYIFTTQCVAARWWVWGTGHNVPHPPTMGPSVGRQGPLEGWGHPAGWAT